ncbi:MAG: hypothetical protein Q4E78_03640 [Eubacteriales bacterium]|nr:hypothetical protein [Eubacteriales bacterium]
MKRFKDMKGKWALILAFVMIVSVVVPVALFTAADNVNAETGKSYDKTSLSYTGTYTDISLKKDADFENAKYVSSSDEIIIAFQSAKAGDVIIIKGGTYNFSETVVINNTINGQDGSYIIVKAEDNQDVKFDFSAQALNSQNRGLILDGDYWYFGGINFYRAGDNGVLLAGNNNIFERCVFEANRDTGLQLSRYDTTAATKDLWPSNNLIINCTAFDNCDFPEQGGTGENADGFAAKLTCGEGNVFDGCISYCNSDDGWDLFAKKATGSIGVVTIRNCVAFANGTLTNGKHYSNGDMNGFKLGGSGVGTPHNVLNCLSFNNGATGFTDNNNPSELTLTNLTAWGNGKNAKKGNFVCYRAGSGAEYSGLISVDAVDSDKFNGSMKNSIYYNSKKYYQMTGDSFTQILNGDKKGTVVNNPSSVSGAFKNVNNTIKYTDDIDKLLRNADGTINMNGLYETTGSYSSMGAKFNVANQVVYVTGKSSDNDKETESSSENTTETTTAQETTKSDGTVSNDAHVINFTTDKPEQNTYFTISGNYSESKGSVIYNGMTLTKCLKIETATSISFTCDTDSELTLVFNSDFAKKIKIDGVKTAATNGIVKVKVAKGTHTITKGDTTNLFYISVAPLSSEQETTTAQENSSTQQTTTIGQEESATKGTEQEITTAKTEKASTAASGEVSDNSTKTGDSSHVMVYVIVLAACVVICAGVIIFSAKKKK